MRLLFFFTILYSFSVLGYQSSQTSSQRPIKWTYSNIPIRVLNTSSSLPSSTSYIDQAISEWNTYSVFNIQRVTSGINQISFSNNFAIYGSAVVGVTEVSYGSSGYIKSASIFLNEQNYDFTSIPGLSFGNTIYLKDVMTHELGHFIGLSHSEVLNSSMFYQTFPGQAELGADDKAGLRNKYDSGYGKISGQVKGGNDIGILGVNVQAISRKNGEAIASVTDEEGSFEIGGLDLDDTYYLHTSSLKNLNSLPSYFATVQTEFCPSAYVASFFSQCGRENDGIAQGISLNSSQTEVNVGDVSINCGVRIQEEYVLEKLQTTFNSLEVFNYGLEPRVEKTFVGFFKPSELTTTSFTAGETLTIDLSDYAAVTGKYLKLRLISQPFGHAVEYTMTVIQNSVTVGSYTKTSNSEGTYKLDLVGAHALSSTVSENKFTLEIKAKKLTTTDTTYSIPDFANFGSVQNLPYLLVMSLETVSGPVIDTGVTLSDNASCLDAPFTYAVEKSTATADEESSATTEQAASPLSCGTIDPPSGPGPSQFLLVLTFGFLLAFLPSRFAKSHKKILS